MTPVRKSTKKITVSDWDLLKTFDILYILKNPKYLFWYEYLNH